MKPFVIFWSLCALLMPIDWAAGQQSNYDSAFAAIPAEHRARLTQRLRLIIAFQVKQEWAKEYDMFSASRRRSESKSDFISLSRKEMIRGWKSPLLDFVPLGVEEFKPDRGTKYWDIAGCATLQTKDGKELNKARIEAYWESNDWFFSEVILILGPDQHDCGR